MTNITADACYITADTTKVTADGKSLKIDSGVEWDTGPMGPGFFILFHNKPSKSGGDSGNVPRGTYQAVNRIREEDDELLLILQLAVTYKLI